jgi:hypothetical protein
MADADVPITAGSGTKIDTRTVGSGTDEHRQVVVIGDPTTASDVAPVTAATGLLVTPTGNVAHDDVDSGNPVKIGGQGKTSAPTAVADGDRVNAWFNERGSQAAFITSESGSDQAHVVGGSTWTSDNISGGAIGSTLSTTAYGLLFDGTNWDRPRGDSTGGAWAQGPAAHDSAVAGNPQLVGFEAKDQDGAALPNAVNAEGDIVRAAASLSGVQYVMPVNEDGSALATVKLDAGTNNIGDVDVLSIAAGDNNIGNVDIVTMPNVTLAAGTNTNEVVGDVAHSVAAAGNPVLLAGVSQNHDDTAPPNRVDAESDATRLATDWDGSLFVRPHGPQVWTYHLNTSTAQTDTTVHAAPGSGLSLYVGTIVFSSGAGTAINMFLEEGASTVMGPYYLEAVAGRGMAVQFNPPRKITANTALTLTTSASIAHSVDITGFTAQG